MNVTDSVFADLRLHEARQSAIARMSDKRADYISAEVLKSEFQCKASDISDFIEGDEDFHQDLCMAVAKMIRDPKNICNIHRVISAFDHAVERQAAKEYDDWRSA
jgi:hypothetical protein